MHIPDFIIGGMAVECAFWNNVNVKAKELSEKIQNYRKLELETIVVTKGHYVEQYSKVLNHLNVRVITPNKLTEVLDGKSGRVKRA